jgi:hypothetical protein
VHPASRFENRFLLTGGNFQAIAPSWCIALAFGCSHDILPTRQTRRVIIRMQVVTTARAADQIAFIDQTFKHQRRGIARDAKLAGELAARREMGISRENTTQNGIDQRFANLLLKSTPGVKIYIQ